jgi:general secretion pathway protein E/type IV pilus assembly protein PilB
MPPQLKRFQAALISRIKVMSGMNISEKRLPQDGRINVRIKGEEIDIRVSTGADRFMARASRCGCCRAGRFS